MGDISAEPSMEDILSSIKRIIAEEGDGAVSRAKRPVRLATRADPQPFDHEEILELSEPAPRAVAEPEVRAPVAAPAPMSSAPAAPVPVAVPDTILSQRTAEASRGSLDALSRMVVKPEVSGADTLEGMVRDMLRPMLKDWLDANLPTMVEAMVAREIERITGK